jgi:hypothetical protein
VAVFQIVAGCAQLAARNQPPPRLVIGGVAMAAFGLLLATSAAALGSAALFCVGALFTGAGYGCGFSGAAGIGSRSAPAQGRATIVSFTYIAGYLGNLLPSPTISGFSRRWRASPVRRPSSARSSPGPRGGWPWHEDLARRMIALDDYTEIPYECSIAERVDPAKDAINQAKHGLSLGFGDELFGDDNRLVVPSIRPRDGGKLYTAVFVWRKDVPRLMCQEKQ